jgi:hypothetical protein
LAKNGVVGNSSCLVAQCRAIGTCLAGLRKNDVPKDLEHFWMGHEDEEIGDRYSKLKDVVAFRKELLERIGLGFELPSKNTLLDRMDRKSMWVMPNCWL